MISDEMVRETFQPILDTLGGYMHPLMRGQFVQIYRGLPRQLWKDAHKDDRPGGCLRHKTVFEKYDAIPKYCFDCYKVEIAPCTVVQLFKLLMVFEKIALPGDNSRKCMCEGRPDCSGFYKGFVYCRGLDEGKEVRKILKRVVSHEISPQIPVTLKRGCSEFARSHPGYARIESGKAKLEYQKKWRVHEEFVDQNVRFPPVFQQVNASGTYLPEEIYSLQYWLTYAATIGDESYLTISGKILEPSPQVKRPC
ncbi:MAG: hypothetical protein GZ085_01510 [Sulfuriferula multivorans]|uniref:Uncharacterized protein n=1 Tax=Sulfuriferula multivorans TaxID=1559896 RepID=A0A7C9P4W2_9PROT|nr:hypothetical protein [Sulfuriferula multivorans]